MTQHRQVGRGRPCFPQRLAFVEHSLRAFEHRQLRVCILIAGARGALHSVESPFYRPEIRERELELDHVAVADGIDRTHHVRDVGIVEAADDLYDGVGLADVRKELVA